MSDDDEPRRKRVKATPIDDDEDEEEEDEEEEPRRKRVKATPIDDDEPRRKPKTGFLFLIPAIVLAIGIGWTIYGLTLDTTVSMDTTVPTKSLGRIHNIGLMAEKQSLEAKLLARKQTAIIGGLITTGVGVVILIGVVVWRKG